MMPNDSQGHLLPAAVAWIALTAACYYGAIPVQGVYSRRTTVVDDSPRIPALLKHRSLQALLLFVFHTLIFNGGYTIIWALVRIFLDTPMT